MLNLIKKMTKGLLSRQQGDLGDISDVIDGEIIKSVIDTEQKETETPAEMTCTLTPLPPLVRGESQSPPQTTRPPEPIVDSVRVEKVDVIEPPLPEADQNMPHATGSHGEADNGNASKPGTVMVLGKGRLPKIERYFVSLKAANYSPNTIQGYKYDWEFWIKEARGKKRTVYNLRKHEIEEIICKLKPCNARRKIAVLKNVAEWYADEKHSRLYTQVHRLKKPKLVDKGPGDRGSEVFNDLFTKSQKWCKEGNRLGIWVGLMITAGLRVSEVQTVTVRQNQITVLGKGSKERSIIVPAWLIKAINSQEKNGKNGWAKSRKYIWKVYKKEGIGKPHSLRHTCASEALRRGDNFEKIKRVLGHANISTTSIYARSSDVPDIAATWELRSNTPTIS